MLNGTGSRAWNEKYWDLICNLFLTPKYMGFQPIKRADWQRQGGRVSVPEAQIADGAHALYSRKPMSKRHAI
jgi:hypothetical protein